VLRIAARARDGYVAPARRRDVPCAQPPELTQGGRCAPPAVTRGYAVRPGEGVPDRGPDVKASGRSTGGSLTVIEATIDGGPPRHTHSREDESFYVLTGTLDVECGEDRFRANSPDRRSPESARRLRRPQ
jgi:hypothetical protein